MYSALCTETQSGEPALAGASKKISFTSHYLRVRPSVSLSSFGMTIFHSLFLVLRAPTMVASSGPEPTEHTMSEQTTNSCHLLLNPMGCFFKHDGVVGRRTFSADRPRDSLARPTTRDKQERTPTEENTTTTTTTELSCASCMYTGMATCTGLSLYFFKMALLDVPKQGIATNKRFFLVSGTVWAAAGIYRYHLG
jgi:hypothetical protein